MIRRFANTPADIARIVYTERNLAGLSRTALARKAGVAVDEVTAIEAGEKGKNETCVAAVLWALEVTIRPY